MRESSNKLTCLLGLLSILFNIIFLLIALRTWLSINSPSGKGEEDSGEKYEKPLWSVEDDPNYKNGLEELLEDTEAAGKKTDDRKTNENDNPDHGTEKPSYMFSLPDLNKLVRNEIQIHGAMKSYLSELETRVDRMKRWVRDYEESTIKAAFQVETKGSDVDPLTELVINPIFTHRMIRRFSKDLKPILELAQSPIEQKFVKEMNRISVGMTYPDVEEDYTDSIEALLRIQQYNNYTTQDLKDGKLGTLQTNISLIFYDAYDLAVHSHDFQTSKSNSLPLENWFPIRTLAIEWMEMALKLFDDEGVRDDELKHSINGSLAAMVKAHDDTWASHRNYDQEWYFDNPIGSDFGAHLPQRPRFKRDLDAIAHRAESDFSVHTRSNFRTLCSGRNLQTEAEKAELKCWYDSKIHPYWLIQPIKKEALSLVPELYQMYDILSPGARKYLIEHAAPELERSVVVMNLNDSLKRIKSRRRTSNHKWIDDRIYRDPKVAKPDPKLIAIARRVEYSSGLNVLDFEASESIQIASYGGSHHYDEHLDVGFDPGQGRSHRIATYMFYLNDVEVGGKTAFPVMGTAASPVAGSAVIWYNLKKNGDIDYRTYHGGIKMPGRLWTEMGCKQMDFVKCELEQATMQFDLYRINV